MKYRSLRYVLAPLAALALSSAAIACFSPELPSQFVCGEDQTCPPGLRCEASANVCVPTDQPGVAELHFAQQPGDVEAGTSAPEVVVHLRSDTGEVLRLTGGTFAVELEANDSGVNLVGSGFASADDGEVRFEQLRFDRPGRGLRLVVHGGDLQSRSAPFDVTTTRPLVRDVKPASILDGCATVSYRLEQQQSLPVDLLVEFDPDGASGPAPFRRATQAASEPGKAGVDGVPGSPEGRLRTFTWNTWKDSPFEDTTGELRITPILGGVTGTPATATVQVKNGPRWVPFDVGDQSMKIMHELDGDHDGRSMTAGIDFALHQIVLDGMDPFPIPEGETVHDFAIGDFNGDALVDVVVGLSSRTVVAFQRRVPARHLDAGVDVGPAMRQVVTVDLDRDGLADIAGIEASTGNLVVLAASRAAPETISERARPWTGGGASVVRAGDLDRDGWPDLVLGRSSPTAPIVVLRGTSLGFQAPTTDSGLLGGVFDIGDVDLDGKDDIAALDGTGLHVATATGRVDVPSVKGRIIAVREVDGDGRTDIVTASGDLVLLHQHVPERDQVGFRPAVAVGQVPGVTALLVGSFSNQAKTDIYAVKDGGTTSSLVIFNTVRSHRCNPRLAGPVFSEHDMAWGGVLADVNVDGKLDHLSYTGGITDHRRLVVEYGLGDGRFQEAEQSLHDLPESNGLHGLSAQDFDHNGAVDFAFYNPGADGLTVLYNDLAEPGTLEALAVPAPGPLAIAIGDMDEDGASDLLSLSLTGVQIVYGNARGARQFEAPMQLDHAFAGQDFSGFCFCDVQVADLDGDGHLDILVRNEKELVAFLRDASAARGFSSPVVLDVDNHALVGFADTGRAEIILGHDDADGNPAQLAIYALRPDKLAIEKVWTSAMASPAETAGIFASASVDVDGDGANELVVSFRGLEVLSGPPYQLRPLRRPYSAVSMLVGDLDTDGHADLVLAGGNESVGFLAGDDGRLDMGEVLTTIGTGQPGGFGTGMALGDFSGDGLADLATFDPTIGEFALFRQSHAHPGRLEPQSGTVPGSMFLKLGDVDGDRRADAVTFGRDGRLVFSGLDSGSPAGFCSAESADWPLAVADITGDGNADLVTSGLTHVEILQASTDSCLAPIPIFAIDRPGRPHRHPVALQVIDMNRDGWQDVVVVSDAVRVALQNAEAPGTFTVTDYEFVDQNRPYLDASVADLTMDGYPDVVTIGRDGSLRMFRSFFGDHLLPSRSVTTGEPGQPGWSLTLADLDGDGWGDIVTSRPGTTDVYLQRNADLLDPGHFEFAYRTIGATGSAFDVERATLVDFDQDGIQDLVYVDPAEGTMLLRGR